MMNYLLSKTAWLAFAVTAAALLLVCFPAGAGADGGRRSVQVNVQRNFNRQRFFAPNYYAPPAQVLVQRAPAYYVPPAQVFIQQAPVYVQPPPQLTYSQPQFQFGANYGSSCGNANFGLGGGGCGAGVQGSFSFGAGYGR